LEDDEICAILKRSGTPEVAADKLIAAANEAGGQDNITVIVARLLPLSQSDVTPPDGVAFLPRV
jgi:PPM family protein phosphatase